MNKELFFKIAKVRNMQEFYSRFPDEDSFMKVHKKEFDKAQRGAKIAKAQEGYQMNGRDYISNILNPQQTVGGAPSAGLFNQPQLAPKQATQEVTQQGMNAFNSMVNKPNLASGIPILGDVVKGFQQLKDERNKLKKTKQWKGVSDVQLQASQTTDVDARQSSPESIL
jgi:hypothetical protein